MSVNPDSQFPRRQIRLVQRQLYDPVSHLIGDTVPDLARPRAAVLQGLRSAGPIAVVPAIKRGAGNAQLRQRALGRQMGSLNQPDDLQLLR